MSGRSSSKGAKLASYVRCSRCLLLSGVNRLQHRQFVSRRLEQIGSNGMCGVGDGDGSGDDERPTDKGAGKDEGTQEMNFGERRERSAQAEAKRGCLAKGGGGGAVLVNAVRCWLGWALSGIISLLWLFPTWVGGAFLFEFFYSFVALSAILKRPRLEMVPGEQNDIGD
ncbi:uncharacterized protein LY79DRAFT_187156 [Colletotrichum navitas]|uniref:Uncharacterized protein n=1 Tax=Colletotrichum navitas TaxID=681940 RepID=A0AAD8PZV7_9PEZI|nr:uncharacterized protein LY79DRAFT_187156 [Colletotrichum navitas]KAK1593098.1 hypothetical protein LY79DRAFT_187156 [Colletotrichum navitas]